MIDYAKEGDLHLVTMNDGPNTICPGWQQRMLEILQGKLACIRLRPSRNPLASLPQSICVIPAIHLRHSREGGNPQ